MINQTPVFENTAIQVNFPALALKKVEKMREEHKALLKRLFPKSVRLQRLIIDIEKNFTTEIASIIGSVDFAQERLVGLLSALKELESQINAPSKVALEEVREQIRDDHRIHESLEDLVFDCVRHTLDSDLL